MESRHSNLQFFPALLDMFKDCYDLGWNTDLTQTR